MLRSIREEPAVTQSLKSAGNVYPRIWDAFEGLCWILARREIYGTTISTVRDVYYLHKQAAGGYGVPALSVLYTVSEDVISLHALKIG